MGEESVLARRGDAFAKSLSARASFRGEHTCAQGSQWPKVGVRGRVERRADGTHLRRAPRARAFREPLRASRGKELVKYAPTFGAA